MRHVLSPRGKAELEGFVRSEGLVALDFDGTLAPIQPDRTGARMRPETAQLLAETCERYPCAILSGRSVDDVRDRLGKALPAWIIGNHGVEPGPRLAELATRMEQARTLLEEALEGCEGIDIEDKRYSISVHFREAPGPVAPRLRLDAALAALPSTLRISFGKQVANVVAADAPHKGDALRSILSEGGLRSALYVGDDTTDEDVFALALAPGLSLVPIRVGQSTTSLARWYLRDQIEIDALLRLLNRARGA